MVKKLDGTIWDIVVLTASNKNQAAFYKQQIEIRADAGTLESGTIYKVVSDDGGKRIGSGGATLSIMKRINTKYGLDGKKVLLIHSGGDSKRVPQYSACGKLFSPVLKNSFLNYPLTLFDEIINSVKRIPARFDEGFFVLSGDVLISIDDANFPIFNGSAVSLSTKAKLKSGTRHGVFLTDANGQVIKFLHKQDATTLSGAGAVDAFGNVKIDTGAVYFGKEIVRALCSLVNDPANYNAFVNEKVRLNLYSDFLFPMAKKAKKEDYLCQQPETQFSDELLKCRETLWNLLQGFSIKAHMLEQGRFIHFGTTSEVLKMVNSIEDYASLGWVCQVACNQTGVFCAYNSYVEDASDVHGYIENSILKKGVKTAKNVIISGAILEDIEIPDNTVVSVYALENNRYCARIYSVDCNPKESGIWTDKRFPVFDKIEDCSSVIKHFFANDKEYFKSEKISFYDSFMLAVPDKNLNEQISLMRRKFYLRYLRNDIKQKEITSLNDFGVCKLPLRVNFAGSWTDTPPYTNDFGGKVINASITIGEGLPVCCKVERIKERQFELISADFAKKTEVATIDEFFNFDFRYNNFFIHKAACIACGIISKKTDLQSFFDRFGGIRLTTSVTGVPKGSGLGTSSILCAAMAKAIYDFIGFECTDTDIIRTVLTMEQIMNTGGGWQDQIGGYIKGIKITTALPGAVQNFNIEKLNVSAEFIKEFEKRYVLIYTGEQRLARNLLKKAMDNVYEQHTSFRAISRIKSLADEMIAAFQEENLEKIAALFNTHWMLSNLIYDGTSTRTIINIMQSINHLTCGGHICGAGGGGFLQIMLRPGVLISDLKKVLDSICTDCSIKAYPVKLYL